MKATNETEINIRRHENSRAGAGHYRCSALWVPYFVINEVSHVVSHSRPAPLGFSRFQFFAITCCIRTSAHIVFTVQHYIGPRRMGYSLSFASYPDFLPHIFSPKGLFLGDRFFLAAI